MPTPQYVDGATGMQKGVKLPETGIKIESIEWTINDPKEYSFDEFGGHDGFCHNYNPSIEITVSGEISDETSGIPVAQFGTAITFANQNNCRLDANNRFANVQDNGGFYPEEVSFSESRDGFRSMTIRTISHPAIN